jgi:hypothetical protein
VYELWQLWWSGVPKDRIAPYRYLKGRDVSRAQATSLSKASKVIQRLLATAKLQQSDVAAKTTAERENVLKTAWTAFLTEVNKVCTITDKRDSAKVSYVTAYDYIEKKRQRKGR